jgi:hypothetical protein
MGDAIYQFGPINYANHDNFQAIVKLVKQNLNFLIIVKVLRKNLLGQTEDVEIKFVP